jgi:hypothetical protein
MQQHETMRANIIALLTKNDPALANTYGDIHVYYSPDTENTHILATKYNCCEKHCMNKSEAITSSQIIDLKKYFDLIDTWEIQVKHGFLKKFF